MAVLTTTPTEVANNLSVTVGCRLLAWYSDATNSGATVHLKLQAISQGINYTGTNKNYDLQLGSSSVTDVAWSYAPLNYNTWYDVYEMTQWVDSGATVYAQGKIWTYVYGAAYTSANLTMPTFGTAPTGLSLSDIVRHADGFSGTVSITGWGGVGDANSRYRELQVWTHSSSGLTPPRRWQIARGNNLSGVITVNNSSSTSDPALTITPNTMYTIGIYATNGTYTTGAVRVGDATTLAAPAQISLASISGNTLTYDYSTTPDGGTYDKDIQYSFDDSTWSTGATVVGGSASYGQITVTLPQDFTGESVHFRISTLAGNTDNGYLPIAFTKSNAFYGPVRLIAWLDDTVAVRAANMYCSVNGFTKVLKKLYGPTEDGTRLVFQGFGRLTYDYGTLTYYTDNTYTTTATVQMTNQYQVDSLSDIYPSWTVTVDGVTISNDMIKEVNLSTAKALKATPSYFLNACSHLDKVILPNNLQTIDSYFLYNCSNFNSSLTLPANIQTIEGGFLRGCNHFDQDITMPTSLTSIDMRGFLQYTRNMTGTIDFGNLATSVISYSPNAQTLSTTSSSSPSYINGIKIAGTYRSDWLTQLPNLPNGTVTNYYRNLIDAGH